MPTVLIIEDYQPCRKAAARLLEHEGYRVLTAGSVDEALEILCGDESVDLILLDCDLPGNGGRTCLQRLAEHAPLREVPVIIVSGTATCRHLASQFSSLVRQWFIKGQFAGDSLLQAIQRHIVPAIPA